MLNVSLATNARASRGVLLAAFDPQRRPERKT
jgi:hypothetical protein